MKTIYIVLAVAFSLASIVALAESTSGNEPSKETGATETWDQWDAGVAFAPGEPWKVECEKKCWSLKKGVEKAEKWGEGTGYYHRKHSYRIYVTYQPWFILFAAGVPPIWIAQTCRTESEGEADNVTNSVHCETGLCSVNRKWAKKLNVNSCDPKANLYATGWMRNNRLIELREAKPWITKASLEEQWFLAGAAGAAGPGKVDGAIKHCGLKGSKTPYSKIGGCFKNMHAKWIKASKVEHWIAKLDSLDAGLEKIGVTHEKWRSLEKYKHLYDGDKTPFRKMFTTTLGYKPGLVSLRTQRHKGAKRQISPLYEGGEMPWGEPELPTRPDDIAPYPGDKEHGQCWRWPELKNRLPSFDEWLAMKLPVPDVRDPSVLRCVKGFKGKLACRVVK